MDIYLKLVSRVVKRLRRLNGTKKRCGTTTSLNQIKKGASLVGLFSCAVGLRR